MNANAHTPIRNQIVWFNSDMVPTFEAEWFSDAYWEKQGAITGQSHGRGTTTFFKYAGKHLVLRHYRRGGLPGKFLTDQFWYAGLAKTRAWQELNLLLQLQELDLPVPAPVAARVSKSGLIYRSDIVLEKIPNASDVHHILMKSPLSQQVWQNIGQTIARFHRFGVYHHDLNIHNIMLDSKHNVWLIDFDKCAIRKGENWKRKNLDRLLRSLKKEMNKAQGYFFSDDDWLALIKGYQQSKSWSA